MAATTDSPLKFLWYYFIRGGILNYVSWQAKESLKTDAWGKINTISLYVSMYLEGEPRAEHEGLLGWIWPADCHFENPFKGVLHLFPKINMFRALSQNNQPLFVK